MDQVNIIPNILVSHLATSPKAKLAMAVSTNITRLNIQTMLHSSPYTCVHLEINTELRTQYSVNIPLKLLLGSGDAQDFTAQGVTLVNAAALATKAGVSSSEFVRVCTLQYFSKTENMLKNLEIVMPDTLKQLDDVIKNNKSLILSEEQTQYFAKLMATVASKAFLSSSEAVVAAPAVLARVKSEQNLDSFKIVNVDFDNIEEMFVKVSLTSMVSGWRVIRQEVASVISDPTNSLRSSTLVTSEDYCLLVCSVGSPKSSIKYILGIPYSNIHKLPREPRLWHDVKLELQPIATGGQMCKVVFKDRRIFLVSVPENFQSASTIVKSRDSFVILKDSLHTIEDECLQQTCLPFILSHPLPRHMQLLSSPVPTAPILAKPPIARTPSPALTLPQLPSQQKLPPLRPTPPIPQTPAKTMVFHTARQIVPPRPAAAASPTLPTTCPACSALVPLSKPADVPNFAKHFYTHYPISSHLIPEFLQRFSIMLDHKQGIITSCPFFYCSETSEGENIEKHLRRNHQFEVLCFHLSTVGEDFELSPLFLQLMKNCKIEHAKLFIKSNLKKFRAASIVKGAASSSIVKENSESLLEEGSLPSQPLNNVVQPSMKDSSSVKVEEGQPMFNIREPSGDRTAVEESVTKKDSIQLGYLMKSGNQPKEKSLGETVANLSGTKNDAIEMTEDVIISKAQEKEISKEKFTSDIKSQLVVEKRDVAAKEQTTYNDNSAIVARTDVVEIVDKGVVINKNQATEIMKRFFRANVKDEDCRSFLKSRGEEMPIGMVDKLVFFLFDVSSFYQESLQLVKFAVKNLKRIVKKDGSRLNVSFIFESDSFLQMKSIQKYILQYKTYCKQLQMNSKNCSPDILVSLVAKILKQFHAEAALIPLFLTWLGRDHQRKSGKSVDQLEGIVKLAQNVKAGSDWKELTEAENILEKDVLKCVKCDEAFGDIVSVLLHAGNHGDVPVDVRCTKCEDSVETVFIREKKDTLVFRAILTLHLTSKPHIHNCFNTVKLPVSETMCQGCDVSFSSPSEIVQHISSRDHAANSRAVQEYLEFCLVHQLDPVNHAEFPHFIFFLRCIHSLSVNLNIPIRQTMDVVANIHSNFNNLLNVNESSDVRDEVVRKLSSGEPAIFFCFSCNQSFLTVSDIEDHLSSDDHDNLESGGVPRVRCVVCREFVLHTDIEQHAHNIVDASGEKTDSDIVEVIDIEEVQPKPSNKVENRQSQEISEEYVISSDEVVSVIPQVVVEESISSTTTGVEITDASKEATEECVTSENPSEPEVASLPPPDINNSPFLIPETLATNDEAKKTCTTIDQAIITTDNLEKVEDTERTSGVAGGDSQVEETTTTIDNGDIVEDCDSPINKTGNENEETVEENLLLEESASKEDVSSKVFNTETVVTSESNIASEIIDKVDQTIVWLLDKTKALKSSALSSIEVEQSSPEEGFPLTEEHIEVDEGVFGNPINYSGNNLSHSSDLLGDAIAEANISNEDLNFQEGFESDNGDLPSDHNILPTSMNSLNDNVTNDEKVDDALNAKDQNNSNIPSWEFVPIKGQNFQFHVFPSVDSIPADPVENIKFDISLKEILEMRHKEGGFFKRNRVLEEQRCEVSSEMRKASSSPDSYLNEYKKLKMDLKVSLSPCEIPSYVYSKSQTVKDCGDKATFEEISHFGISEEKDLSTPVEDKIKANTVEFMSLERKGVTNSMVGEGPANSEWEESIDTSEQKIKNNDATNEVESFATKIVELAEQPVKRGRGRPRKNPIVPKTPKKPTVNSNRTKPIVTATVFETVADIIAMTVVEPVTDTVETVAETVTELNLEATKLSNQNYEMKSDMKSSKLSRNEDITVDNSEVSVKKLVFRSGPVDEISTSSLVNEFEFDSVETSREADISVEKDDDSSSDYEDSDDELEIIDEIVADEGSDKALEASSVKVEPNELIEKVAEKEFPVKDVPKVSEQLPDPDKKLSATEERPAVPNDNNLFEVENEYFHKVECNSNKEQPVPENGLKRKIQAVQKSEENEAVSVTAYQPMMFDVKVVDIARSREWREEVEPQVKYLKRRAAVINRWENDIQAYFKQRS